MALPPQTNEAFLREVDDELRRDQLLNFWQRWGRLTIGAIVLALAVFAGVLWWQHHREAQAGERGEALQGAFDSIAAGDNAKALAQLGPLASASTPGYSAMARFTEADLLLQKNDVKGAVAKFAAIAGDDKVGEPLRNLALVRQTAAEFDMVKPQVVVQRLTPLAQPGSAWLGSAGEMVAMADLKLGNRAAAATMFDRITGDPNVPDTIRQRTVQMAGLLSAGAGTPPTSKEIKAQ